MRRLIPGILLAAAVGCNSATSPGPAPDGMVWVPPGEFWMGSDTGPADERPRHRVRLDGFWMDRTEVTNAQFAAFVAATGYVTVAERPPDPSQFPPDRPLLHREAGSAVFVMPKDDLDPNEEFDGP